MELPRTDPELVDRVCAEAWELGVSGVEERSADDGGTRLLLYVSEGSADGIAESLARRLEAMGAVARVALPVAVGPVDWSEAWKHGHRAIEIARELVVHPSFVPHRPHPGQRALVVDPGRAFGTGSHASTRLALEWLCARAGDFGPDSRVLDVGTGTGILALAAVALGAGSAVGLDIDSEAPREARRTARSNGMADRLGLLTGGIDAVAGARFDWVLANMLRSEMLPIADALASAVGAGGRLVLSGLLTAEVDEVVDAFEARGMERSGLRTWDDETGDAWAALLMTPRSEPSRR